MYRGDPVIRADLFLLTKAVISPDIPVAILLTFAFFHDEPYPPVAPLPHFLRRPPHALDISGSRTARPIATVAKYFHSR